MLLHVDLIRLDASRRSTFPKGEGFPGVRFPKGEGFPGVLLPSPDGEGGSASALTEEVPLFLFLLPTDMAYNSCLYIPIPFSLSALSRTLWPVRSSRWPSSVRIVPTISWRRDFSVRSQSN